MISTKEHCSELQRWIVCARLGELLGLQWKHIDLNVQTLEIRQALWEGELVTPKTEGSVRLIYFGPSLLTALMAQKQNSNHNGPDDFVFCKDDGAPLNPDVLRRMCSIRRWIALASRARAGRRGFTRSVTLQQPSSPENREPETRSETARALQPEHDGRCVYTHTSTDADRNAALALEQAIFGNLFQVVPSFGTWNKNAAAN